MAQGYIIDPAADTITFLEPVASTSTVVVTETDSADVNATDIWAFGAWNPGFGYPAEVEFYGDRLCWANSRRQPQTIWMSKSGQYIKYGKSVPLIDDDAITITINARQVNAISELVPLDDLLILTMSCEWKMTTGTDGVVAPGKVGFKPQSFWGSSILPALIVGESALYIQRSGNQLRDTAFQFADDKYAGNNLTIYASHLVEDHEIVDLAFQQHPYSCAWLVRSDGKLISVTYVREQQVVGFALHRTDGLVRRVCVVPEDGDDVLYLTVERENSTGRFLALERLKPSNLKPDPRMAFYVDSGLTFDGRQQTGTQTLSGGTGDWLPTEAMTLTGSSAHWVGTSDIGDQVRLRIASTVLIDGEEETTYAQQRVEIIGYTDSMHVTVRPLTEVPAAFRNVAISEWEVMRDTFQVQHLSGKTVAILRDGFVDGRLVVPEDGELVLPEPGAVVHIGLPYQSVIESLDLAVGDRLIRDKPKLITNVALLLKDTRGCKAGPDLDHLDDFKVREFEDLEDPVALVSGVLDVAVVSDWNRNGRFVVAQDDPLPACILSLMPDFQVVAQ